MKKEKNSILLVTAAILGGVFYAFKYIKKAYTDGINEINHSIEGIDLN